MEMFANPLDKLHLLFKGKSCDSRLDNSTEGDFVNRNEAVVVHVCKESHDKLAVHTIGNSAMPRNRIAKIFDLESTFEARGKEATEWSNKRGESSEYEDVNLHWCHVKGLHVRKPDWKVVEVRYEDGVRYTFKASEDICTKVLPLLANYVG